jgi:SAM-dependent methyltransferase
VIVEIELPTNVMDRSIPADVRNWIVEGRQRVQRFQDVWDRRQIEQFVACDYELVYQSLDWIVQQRLATGRRFLEWGCGFATVCGLAAQLGFDVVGIEAEHELLQHGRSLIEDWGQPAELVHGNFLPRGSEVMADDPTLPSLGHPLLDPYADIGLEVDDFAIVFAYPWPGEEEFLAQVFDRYAAIDALFLHYCGPYDMRLLRKLPVRAKSSKRQ